jgi:hypothetical protein
MEEKKQEILTKQAPPEDFSDWKSSTVIVNGISLTVEEYYKSPELHNSHPLPQYLIDSVYQSLPERKRKELNLINKKDK